MERWKKNKCCSRQRGWKEFDVMGLGVECSEGRTTCQAKAVYLENDAFIYTWSLIANFIDKTIPV